MPYTPTGNFGPRTPSRCIVCRAPIPKVDDLGPGVEKWARYLNYQNHLKKYHPQYYKWSKRWTYSLWLPIIPSFIIAYISTAIRSVSLLSIGVAVLVILYVPLFLYRWKRVRDFRETWSQEGEAGNT